MKQKKKTEKKERSKATCINFLYIWFHQHNGIGYFRIFLLFSSISSRLAQRIHHRKCEKVLRMILSKTFFSFLLFPLPPVWFSYTLDISSLNWFLCWWSFVWVSHMSSSIIWFAFSSNPPPQPHLFYPLTNLRWKGRAFFFFTSFMTPQ